MRRAAIWFDAGVARGNLRTWIHRSVRQGKHSGRYGYDHIYRRGLEKLAAGKANNHEVSPYAQELWRVAVARVGGSLNASSDLSFLAASVKYQTASGLRRTMCVFYDTKNYSEGGVSYKVKGVITAYWISVQSSNPTQDCIGAKGSSD